MNSDYEKVFETASRISDLYASMPDYSALMESIQSAMDAVTSVRAITEEIKFSETFQQVMRSAADTAVTLNSIKEALKESEAVMHAFQSPIDLTHITRIQPNSLEAIRTAADTLRIPLLESIRQMNPVIDLDVISRIRSAVDSIYVEDDGIVFPEELVPEDIKVMDDPKKPIVHEKSKKFYKISKKYVCSLLFALIVEVSKDAIIEGFRSLQPVETAQAPVETVFLEEAESFDPILQSGLQSSPGGVRLPETRSDQIGTAIEQSQPPEQSLLGTIATPAEYTGD